MVTIRPKHLAIGFTAYFGLVAYLAYGVARASRDAWFSPALSTIVYQTTMIGGMVILAALFITAGLVPYRSQVPKEVDEGAANGNGAETGPPLGATRVSRSERVARAAEERWAVGDFLDDPELEPGDFPSPRAVDAAAVSAALSRLRAGSLGSSYGPWTDRLSEGRQESSVTVNGSPEQVDRLARLVNEMKPLLLAAKTAGLDVPGIRRLVSEATIARGRDLGYRVRLLEQMKVTLERSLAQRVSRELEQLLQDMEGSRLLSDQVQDAELTAAEAVAFLDTGHYAAAFQRVHRARELFDRQMGPPLRPFQVSRAPATFAAFAGPALYATVYVAIAAMLLPGVAGFLEHNFALNTGVILFLSYGWLGLVLYAFLSILIASRPDQALVVPSERIDHRF
jgi:hypothetical protein